MRIQSLHVVFGGGGVGIERREKVLSEMGVRVISFGNDDVMMNAERSAMVGRKINLIAV